MDPTAHTREFDARTVNHGPRYVAAPRPTRARLVASNRPWASSTPLMPADTVINGTATAQTSRVARISGASAPAA